MDLELTLEMPRAALEKNTHDAYHVTNRSNNREWFSMPIEKCWQLFKQVCSDMAQKYSIEVHALVLMSNHYHLLLSTPLCNLDRAMRYFQTEISREINRYSGRINHVFGSRYRGTRLRSSYSYAYVYKYIMRNPARAKLCERVELYPYSSLHDLEKGKADLQIIEDFLDLWEKLPNDWEDRLNWLNQPVPSEQEELIRKALRRQDFKFTSQNTYRHFLRALEKSYGIFRNG